MEGKRTIDSIRLKNILSFGNIGECVELQPLNVLIGPNASGKSNFLEIFRLLRALPDNPAQVIRDGDGVSEWLWKGNEPNPIAVIDLDIEQANYRLQFNRVGYQWEINYEHLNLGTESPLLSRDTNFAPNESIWYRLRHQKNTAMLAARLSAIGIYKDWNATRFSPLRQPQRPDLPGLPLSEDLNNFSLVFNNLPYRSKLEIIECLRQVYESIEEVRTPVDGGAVRILIQERGLSSPTPAARISDGTLRYLFLLTLLKQPNPPSLICLEEPEIGLHPDLIHTTAKLLLEASQRTQLIVTTHSELLVSALSEVPEAILVCERDENGTHLNRLDPDSLKGWLERYSLGELWLRGELGGTRW